MLSDELDTLRLEKDTEVQALKDEVRMLRSQNETQQKVMAIARAAQEKAETEAAEKNAKQIAILKEELDKHAADRKEREDKFRDLSNALDDEIALLETSHKEVARPHIGRTSSRAEEAPLVFEGPPSKMQQMMWTLKDMYKSEQESHVSVEQETLKLSEQLGLAPAANYDSFNRKMAQALKATREENEMLREQLAKMSGDHNDAKAIPPTSDNYANAKSPSEGWRSDSQRSSQRHSTTTAEDADPQQILQRRSQQILQRSAMQRNASKRRLQQVKNSKQRQRRDDAQQSQRQSVPKIGERSDRSSDRHRSSRVRGSLKTARQSATDPALKQSVWDTRSIGRSGTRRPQGQGDGDGHYL